MESHTFPSLQNDLNAVSDAIQAVAERFKTMSLEIENDTIVKVAQTTEISSLHEIAIPRAARPVEEVIKDTFDIFDFRIRMNHPRWFGFIPNPASPFSWLGEVLTSGFNTFAGSKFQGSGPGAIEDALIKWLASRVGLPSTAGGCFVSGGSMANLTAMVLARDHVLPHGKEANGVVYVSGQTHSSIAKALRILGFSGNQIRHIPTNDHFQMDTEALTRAIHADRMADLIPFAVVATCGTTNTGSVDPLSDIADVCQNEGIWMHVDGAYGASASLSTSRGPELTKGLGRADSVSWDAHKWLFQTYVCGVILVRDRKRLLGSFLTDAEYLRDATEEQDVPNFWNYGIELTRPARAMKLWFTLQVLGVDMISTMIDNGLYLAERVEEKLRGLPDWEVTSPASMAIVTFRFKPAGKAESEADILNATISKRLIVENVAGILTTKLNGKIVLRICVINPWMSGIEMDNVIEDLDELARRILDEFK